MRTAPLLDHSDTRTGVATRVPPGPRSSRVRDAVGEATGWFGQLDLGDPRWQSAESLLDDLLEIIGHRVETEPLVVKLRILGRSRAVPDPTQAAAVAHTATAIRSIVVAG